jgi:glycosyltransferase involved in cell wall biosynthesis
MPDENKPGMPTLSVSVIANNEEYNIARMLDSVSAIASEIVVVIDKGSCDATEDIARQYGAKVYIEEWQGFTNQKNSSLAKCTCDWILMLDADEVVSCELRQSITEKLNNPEADSYYLNRKTVYLGKLLNFAWQPDRNLRLASRKSNPRWKGGLVHESLETDGSKSVLKGDLIHYSYRDIRHHFRKTMDYAAICGENYFRQGRKFRLANLLLNPVIAFVRLYFINMGFRDGIRGFIAAFSSFVYTFMKYVFLWEFQSGHRADKKAGEIKSFVE